MNYLRLWRERHILLADFIFAAIGAALVIGVLAREMDVPSLHKLLNGIRSPIYTTIAAITGSLLGFILTAVSIIAVFLQTPRFERLHAADRVSEIFAIYISATRWLAFATLWIIVAMVADTDVNPSVIVTAITLIIVVVTSVRVYRCVWALENIILLACRPLHDVQESPPPA